MAIFVTGATGYIGSYIVAGLLAKSDERLALLVRAPDKARAAERLWRSLQLHLGFAEFEAALADRFELFLGDLTQPGLGLDATEQARLVAMMGSVIHCAASLNRKSAKACFNVNLRGTLHLLKLARAAAEGHGLRRFSDISTVAVAGHRRHELVLETDMIDWSRSDYDPYARTKKFCETMVHELLPDVPITVFRPSIVLGDSRRPETTQFDMVQAFVFLARLPFVPFRPEWRSDIVPADFVGDAVVDIHLKDAPRYDAYNLSAGGAAHSYRDIVGSLHESGLRKPWFWPFMERPFGLTVDALAATPRSLGVAGSASLLKVFYPYLTFDTVFDNARVVEELGRAPERFCDYAYGLFRFALDGDFRYPYEGWPEGARPEKVA
jgi:thioester reductase-like protein